MLRTRTPCVVFRNPGGGEFEELMEQAGPALRELHSTRGLAIIDILIMNMNEPPSLFRNDVTGDNHWLKVLLEGVRASEQTQLARRLWQRLSSGP